MVEKTHTSGFWPSIYDPFRQIGQRIAEWVAPASEASGAADVYTITVELPGVEEGDIHLGVDDGVLTLKGEKRVEHEETGRTWYFSERQYGAFSRSFRLPPDADTGSVAAKLKDGVLTVTVNKRVKAKPEASRIAISTG